MQSNHLKWLYLFILALIWGSSFILIKKGLVGLTDFQLGALRIVLTSLFLFAVGFKSAFHVERKHWIWIVITGFLGTFFPAFLFAIAQNHIDSAIASILNSLTPLTTAIAGVALFAIATTRRQTLGIIIGLAGTAILIVAGADFNPDQNYWYSLLIVIATIGYALNVNIIKKYLNNVNALAIVTGNFISIFLPALIILYATGFFETIWDSREMQISFMYVAILALFGTAIAKVIFNKLVQIATPVFASSVTYLMPIVAVVWGLIDGEGFSFLQMAAAVIILFGVYLANKRGKKKEQ